MRIGLWAWLMHVPALLFAALTVLVLMVVAVWEWISFHGGWQERWSAWRARSG